MADVKGTIDQWSTVPADNEPSGSTLIGTGLDDNLREIQKVVRQQYAKTTGVSAATFDLSLYPERYIDVTGTTTITALGTLPAGISKVLIFAGALTLTHNATSLFCPGGQSILTEAGLAVEVLSLGSGNWKVMSISDYTNLDLTITGDWTFSGSPAFSGTPTFSGIPVFSNDINLTGANPAILRFSNYGGMVRNGYGGAFVGQAGLFPVDTNGASSSGTYDLGADTVRWRNLYLSGTGSMSDLFASTASIGTISNISTINANTLSVQSSITPTFRVRTTAVSSQDAKIEIIGARTASSTADIAALHFNNWNSDRNYTLGKIVGKDPAGSASLGNGALEFYTSNNGSLIRRVTIESGSIGGLTVEGNGNLYVGGQVDAGLGMITRDPISASANNVHDIGSSGARFRTIYYYQLSQGSGRDQKTAITPMPSMLQKIKALQPVTYRYKVEEEAEPGQAPTRYGLIAEDTEVVFGVNKSLVQRERPPKRVIDEGIEDKEELSMDYTQLIAPLIKAVQELATKVEALENA